MREYELELYKRFVNLELRVEQHVADYQALELKLDHQAVLVNGLRSEIDIVIKEKGLLQEQLAFETENVRLLMNECIAYRRQLDEVSR